MIGGRGKNYIMKLDNQKADKSHKTRNHMEIATQKRLVEDESWFHANLSKEELDCLVKNTLQPRLLEAKTIKCTVCNKDLNFKIESQCQRHPDLGEWGYDVCNLLVTNCFVGVVVCLQCKDLHGKEGWDIDLEGNEKFCR